MGSQLGKNSFLKISRIKLFKDKNRSNGRRETTKDGVSPRTR